MISYHDCKKNASTSTSPGNQRTTSREDPRGVGLSKRPVGTLDLLRQRDPDRLAVLLYAASHDDWISRAHIYELMDFDPYRKMAGFTKPFDGVRRKLVEEDLLETDIANPMVPRYPDRGGWALGLDLDPEMGRTLRRKFPSLED
jgi:hypothetical protein